MGRVAQHTSHSQNGLSCPPTEPEEARLGMRPISCTTRFCAVIGNPVGHRLSPAIHNAAYEALDLDFVYVACPVEDAQGALAGMRALGNFRGIRREGF